MNRQNTLLLAVPLVALSVLLVASPASQPDLTQLQHTLKNLVAARWDEEHPRDPDGIDRTEIRRIQRADELLTGIPASLGLVKPLEDAPVYVADVVAHAKWWKQTTEHVLVLQLTNDVFKPLLHFSGGRNWRGVDLRIVDVGATGSDFVLMVEDHGCGNQTSQTRTHLFRWNKKADRFDEVFNQLTTWLPSVAPVVYESSVSFVKSSAMLKDVVVRTKLIRRRPTDGQLESVYESVFKWNGAKYAGVMKKPAGAPE